MPAGLEIWDAEGNLVLSVTNRLGVLLGWIDTAGIDSSITVPGFSRGTPFFFVSLLEAGPISARAPRVTVAGQVLTWVYADGSAGAAKLNARIFYGIY